MRTKKRRQMLSVALAGGMLLPAVLHAQSQQEMNREAERDFATADAELNRTYKGLLSGGLSDEDKEELKAAQRLWVQFRDAQAKFEADLEARGGSMRPMAYEGCRSALTKARSTELQRILKSGD